MEPRLYVHTTAYILCLKKRPTFDLLYVDIHDLITTIFGSSVTETVRNQKLLCFPTSPI